MNSFLSHIAKAYYENEKDALLDYCFIFPNKRSGVFFRQELQKIVAANNEIIIEPEVITISELVAQSSNYIEASRFDLLFTLYTEYAKLSSGVKDFDTFAYWGDILISDFNDIDMYMADARKLLKNVRDQKEISADFLSDEQKSVINQYWDANLPLGEPESFWKHINDNDNNNNTDNRDKFLELWQVMDSLYTNYRKSLMSRGLCYSGMQYREMAEKLKDKRPEDLPYKRYVFIGFNVLSISEVNIFDRLKQLGIADFYWDFVLPEKIANGNRAAYFIKKYVNKFPSCYAIDEHPLEALPNINIVAVPSNIGQVKYATDLLSDLVNNKIIADAENAIDTAVVLPDEELFIDMLHSLPPEIGKVNITMGFPLKLTPVATLLNKIISMHLRARRIKDDWNFYYEDVINVLSHQLVQAYAANESSSIIGEIERNRLFMVPSLYLQNKSSLIKDLFYSIDNLHSIDEVFVYTSTLIQSVLNNLKQINDEKKYLLEVGFLTKYNHVIAMLRQSATAYKLTMSQNTFFHLIEKILYSEAINFVGEPLCGLQIMGVLETRALSFKNVIMLSMNERVFPRKHYTRSMIPEMLRRAYGMATIEFQEYIYAYYFYRLISRSENVYLIYDSRSGGVVSGEMSRYLYQLHYLYPQDNITSTIAYYDIPSFRREGELKIHKTDAVMAELMRFRAGAEHPRALSASALKKYINCPLSFYYSIICNLKAEDEVEEHMAENTYGTIVHSVLEGVYLYLLKGASQVSISPNMLDAMIHNEVLIGRLVTNQINKEYNKLPNLNDNGDVYENLTELFGEALIMRDLIVYLIKRILQEEKKNGQFLYLGAEKEYKNQILKINDSLSINTNGIIDRIDRVNGRLRIIDYKTGRDEVSVASIHDLFVGSAKNISAIFQLFMYSNLYSQVESCDEPIMPMIYRLRTVSTEGFVPLKIGGVELLDYREFNQEFMAEFKAMLDELFDQAVDFAPKALTKCEYCEFKSLCNK